MKILLDYFKGYKKNTNLLLKAIDIVPKYLNYEDMIYPYIRKHIYAIKAIPEQYNIEELKKLVNETNDEQI